MTANSMLDDDVLVSLLGEAAESFPVPEEGPGFVLEELAVTHPPARRAHYVKWTAPAAAVVVGVLVVQSSGGGTASQKSAPSAAPSPAAANVDSGAAQGAAGSTRQSAGSTWTGSAWVPAERSPSGPRAALSGSTTAVGGAAAPAPATASTAGAVADPFADNAKIVKTGSVALIVSDGKVSTVITKVTGIAKGAGGYVADSKSQEYGDDPSSTVTIRVPVNAFETVVQQVRDQVKNGVGKIDSSSTSGQDVTAQYADVNAQIQSLTAARERFLSILSRANTIGEILSVQQRVDAVQQQIDSLKGRLRVLTSQTSMGTLTVTVSERAKADKKAHVQSGLSKSWDNAKHGFTSGVESMISRSGKALLVLIVAAVGLVMLRSGWRLARRRLV